MSLLLISIGALLLGPVAASFSAGAPRFRAALDGYVLIAIGGLVGLHLAPIAIGDGGVWAVLAMAVGAGLPWLFERGLHSARGDRAHLGGVLFAVGGLALHALLDGAALAAPHRGHEHAHDALALAVVVHRLPMGLMVWWAMSEVAGRRAVAAMLGVMAAATAIGYAAGEALLHRLPPFATAVFIAVVAGALLHVLGHGVEGLRRGRRGPMIVGAVLGALTVGALSLLEA